MVTFTFHKHNFYIHTHLFYSPGIGWKKTDWEKLVRLVGAEERSGKNTLRWQIFTLISNWFKLTGEISWTLHQWLPSRWPEQHSLDQASQTWDEKRCKFCNSETQHWETTSKERSQDCTEDTKECKTPRRSPGTLWLQSNNSNSVSPCSLDHWILAST